MKAKKAKRVLVKETILSMEPGQYVIFTPAEIGESSLRVTVSNIHADFDMRFKVQKVANEYKVTRL